MSNRVVLPSPTVNRRQPSLIHKSTSRSSSSSSRFAEVAGGKTAECAAVCCCCPCGLVNLLVLAIYKVPVGLFRKALKKKRKQQLIKKGLLPKRKKSKFRCGCDDFDFQIHPFVDLQNCFPEESERKVLELDKEMWDIFLQYWLLEKPFAERKHLI